MMVVCSYLPLFYAVGANAGREGMDVLRGAKHALSDHDRFALHAYQKSKHCHQGSWFVSFLVLLLCVSS